MQVYMTIASMKWAVMRCPLALILLMIAIAPTTVIASDMGALVGDWQVRMDGGGEIYPAVIRLRSDAGVLTGTYRADGKKGTVSEVRRENDAFAVQVESKRRGVPMVATFVFDLIDDRWVGDVDIEAGTSMRSYEFQATRLAGGSPAGSPAAEKVAGPAHKPAKKSAVAFQQGANGYQGAVDTELWAIAPSKALDRQGTMTADANNGGGESQVLMQFTNVFGDGEGQAPLGCRVTKAQMTIVVFDPGSTVFLHRCLAPWDESATWDRLCAGVSIDNIEASTVRDGFSFGEITMDKQLVTFDVTQTVQAWADGAPNYGWVFVNTGGNGWDFYSSDWIEQQFRPKLEIEFEPRAGAHPKATQPPSRLASGRLR